MVRVKKMYTAEDLTQGKNKKGKVQGMLRCKKMHIYKE